jgi:glycosyltransferase involved in cell wall biosynthesis
LKELEDRFVLRNWKVIRQQNLSLGAARNNAARHAAGEYILFMDDDNYAVPHEVSTLIEVALRTGADILTCFMQLFNGDMPPENHLTTNAETALFLGAAPAVGTFLNLFGDANALIRREAFLEIGGFAESRAFGHEDYEFFARAVLSGFHLETVPEPLFWYRVSNESMIQTTSHYNNHMLSLGPYVEVLPEHLKELAFTAQALMFENRVMADELVQLRTQVEKYKAWQDNIAPPPASASLRARVKNLLRPILSLPVAALGNRAADK